MLLNQLKFITTNNKWVLDINLFHFEIKTDNLRIVIGTKQNYLFHFEIINTLSMVILSITDFIIISLIIKMNNKKSKLFIN